MSTHDSRHNWALPLSRRSVLKLGVAASVVSATPLAACGQSGGGNGSLKVWGVASFTQAGDHMLADQCNAWGKANKTDIDYSTIPGSDYSTKVTSAVEAKALPDVVMLEDTAPIFYGSQGHLVDVSDVWAKVKSQAGGVFPTLDQYSAVNGKFYSIPMEANLTVLYCQLSVAAKALGEARAPKTLDECEKVARRAVASKLGGFALPLGNTADGNSVLNIVYAEGGQLVDRQGHPSINSDGTVRALERMQRWWKDGLIPKSAPSADDTWNNQQYQSGQVALTMNPPSILAAITTSNPELAKNTVQAPLPAGASGSVQAASTWSWAISSSSKNVEAAKSLITYLMAPSRIEPMYEKVGGRWYPVYQGLTKKKFWADQHAYDQFPKIIQSARPSWYPAKPTATLLSQVQAVQDAYIPVKMAQNVLLKGQSPSAAAKAAQDQMEQTFKQYAKSGSK